MHKINKQLELEVHDNGDIYTIERTVIASNGKQRIQGRNKLARNSNGKSGYYKINASRNGKRVNCLIHRLVYATFNDLDVYDTSYHIGHFDDNPANNHIDNLYLIAGDGKQYKNIQHKKTAYKLLALYYKGLIQLPDGYTLDYF